MKRLIILAAILPLLCLLLGGCLTVAQQQAKIDDAKCQSYGAKPGDPAYVQCRAQLDAAATQASATYSASQPRYDPWGHDDPASPWYRR